MEALWARIRENEKKRDLFISMNPDLAQYRARANAARDSYKNASASYENYMGQDVRFQVANIRIPRLSYDERLDAPQLRAEREKAAAELQRLKKDPSHSNDVMRRIGELEDRIRDIDTKLESVTVAQAKTELANLRASMDSIIENCKKQNKQDDLLNCLCMACGGMLGGYYSKLGDCAGGCTCWGPLSGWCTPIPTGEKHAKNCYGSAYNVKNPTDADVRSLLEKARTSNTKATEAAIRKAIKGNQLDNAFTIGKAAKKLDPGMATPAFGELSGALKKQGWNSLYKADYKTAIQRLGQAVEMNPADSDAKKKLSDANTYAAQWPRIEAKAKEFDEYIAQKKVWSAHRTMLELQDILRPLAAGQSSENPVWKDVNTTMNKGFAWYNDFSQKSTAEWTRLFKEQEWEQAETHLKRVLTYELSPADQKQFTSSLQMVNNMLGQRRTAMQYYENARANFAKGIPADANSLGALARELKNREVYFNQTDPRRKQLDELSAAMEKKQKILNAKAYAQTFFNNGDMYYRAYNFEPAVTQYTEGLRAIKENGDTSDPDYAKYFRLRDEAAAKDKRFKELYSFAAGLAVTEKPLDENTIKKGIGAAEEGLKIRPKNIDMEIHWNKLKWKLGELRRTKTQQQVATRAQQLRSEGQQLQNRGLYKEAIGKYKESLKLSPDSALSARITQMETTLKKPPVKETTATPVQAPAVGSATAKVIFDSGNIGAVYNNPTKPTVLSISTPHVITLIQNYHWNNARGSRLGTIALRSSTGALYGPWQTQGMAGQGGVPNASWICYPNITLPAGKYTVIDSEPSTWSQNSQSGGRGFTRMDGYPAGSSSIAASTSASTSTTRTAPVTTVKSSGSSVIAEFKNASKENVHIFTEGESFSPMNRLTPGEKRKVTVRLGSGGRINFKAGRGGKVLATASWQGDAAQSGRVPVVTFDDSNPFRMLSVTTGLR